MNEYVFIRLDSFFDEGKTFIEKLCNVLVLHIICFDRMIFEFIRELGLDFLSAYEYSFDVEFFKVPLVCCAAVASKIQIVNDFIYINVSILVPL